MNGFLLDTDHAGELLRKLEPVTGRVRATSRPIDLCPVVQAEVRLGLERKRLSSWLGDWDRLAAGLPSLPIEPQDGQTAAVLRVDRERRGRDLKLPDALIAAVAIRYDLALLTADGDFAGVPALRVENWLAP